MTYTEALAYIDALKPGGMKPGLARMERGLSLLGRPQDKLRVIHIAGTNGKGSTARMIQAMATANGLKTGLFTSPAVTGVRDTIQIDANPISEAAFAALTGELAALAPAMGEAGELSEFELLTTMAITWFAREKTDLCVIECGLGGRGDATDVFDHPVAAVLTPVSLDHTAVLGHSVEEIARAKCGILRPGCGVVCSPGQPAEALGVLLEEAAGMGLTVHVPGAAAAPIRECTPGRLVFEWEGAPVSLSLTGAFQRDNALTALGVMRLLETKGFPFDRAKAVEALEGIRMPCRQEVLRRHPLRMLDGAHNPHGIRALTETLLTVPEEERVPLTLLWGMLRDKDVRACVSLLAPLAARAVCCAPDNLRAMPGEALATLFREAGVEAVSADNPEQALVLAREEAGEGPLLVGGSFFLASVIRPFLTKE